MGADHDEWRAHESSEEPSGQGRFSQGSQMCDTFNYSDAGRLADRQSQPAPGSSGTHSQQINEYYEESRFYQQPVGHHHNHLNPLPNTWSHSNYPSQGIAQNSWTGSYDWNAGQAAYYDQSGENSGSDINSAACSQSSCDSGYFSSPRKAVVDDQWNNVAAVGQQTSRSHIGTVEVKEEISFENSHQANHQSDEYQCGSTVPTEIGNTLTNKGIDPQGRTIRWGTIIPLIGGSSLGCQLATGTKPLYHLSFTDFSKNESHLRRYWPDIPYFDLSVNPTIPQDYTRDIDFITTVCPCAGLSMLNTSKGDKMRGSEAVQNIWMIRSAEFVLSVIKPKCFWGENAPGLFTKVGEDVLLMLRNIGAKYNYTLTAVKTNTLLHGIPQSRVRTFYFFWKSPTVPLLGWKLKPRKNLVEYLAEIPAEATHQDWHMTDGKATDRFKPYLFVLQKERLSHKDFSVKFGKGTITEYLFKHNLIDECLAWLKAYHPTEGFYNKGNGCRTFIQYLEHARMKVDQGKGYWDDSPRFVGMDSWPAMIRKSMITAVHPVEDRYLNVREMMHLMGLPMDFQAHGDLVSAVDFSANHLVAGFEDALVTVWELPSGNKVHTLPGHTGGVTGIQMQCELAATASYDCSVRLWNVNDGVCLITLTDHDNFARCIGFSGNRIVSGDFGGNILLWDLMFAQNESGKTTVKVINQRKWNSHKGHVVCLQLNARRIISGSRDRTLMINDFWLKTLDTLAHKKENDNRKFSRFLKRHI